MKLESVNRLLNIISLFNSDHDPHSHSVLTQRGRIKVVQRKKFYCCSKMKCFICPGVKDENHIEPSNGNLRLHSVPGIEMYSVSLLP